LTINYVNISQGISYSNPIYGDANLFCYSRNRLSPKYEIARIILADLIIQKVSLCISNLVVDEMWWALLRVWHRNNTKKKLTPTKAKNDPSILSRYFSLIKRNTEKLLRFPNITILPTKQPSVSIIQEAIDIYGSENLMPRDCFHLAFAKSHNITGFITSDHDFNNLTLPDYDLTVYMY